MEQELQRRVAPTRDHREIPPFSDIKHDLEIPEDARFIGWYINNPQNPLHFVSRDVTSKTKFTEKLISANVERGKCFKLGEYQKALDFVDALPFAAQVTVIFGYVKKSNERTKVKFSFSEGETERCTKKVLLLLWKKI